MFKKLIGGKVWLFVQDGCYVRIFDSVFDCNVFTWNAYGVMASWPE